MSKLEIYIFLQLLVPGLAGGVVFVVDPSSYSLTCNPYGSKIRLPCTVQEPQDLNSPNLLSVLWFWSKKDKNDQITNACHISSHYRCNMLVEHDRYDFAFAREAVEVSREGATPLSVVNRMFDFQISNVSVMDTGCYHYRVWLNDEQLNKTSGVFCLKEESEYQDLPPCDSHTNTTTAASIAAASTESPLTACTLTITDSLTSGDNPINYATAFYVTMVVCAVLMITTCILAIIVAYLTVGRFKKCKGVPSVKGCNAVMDTYRKTAERQLEFRDQVVETATPIPQPLGIYCLAEKDASSTNSKGIYESKIIPPLNPVLTKAQYNKTPSLSLDSPGSHIYQTLDKDFFDELEIMATTKESEDRVFDDTNYSSLRNSQISSISSSMPTLLQRNSTSNVEGAIYDKLKPKQLDLEYSYAYLHVSGHKQANNELLHIAEMGYEMDPIIVSTLMREKNKQQADHVEATASDGHGYQSLDHAKLTPMNSYTSTVVRKE